MTDEAYTHGRLGLRARLSDLTAGARDMARAALKEAMTWDAYKWTVLALMSATFLLVALSYGGIRAELAALKQAQRGSPQDLAAIRTEFSDMKAALTQTMSEMKSGLDDSIAKISAKLDARPKPAAPAPKPAAKPKPQ